jgi:hypothetical protein
MNPSAAEPEPTVPLYPSVAYPIVPNPTVPYPTAGPAPVGPLDPYGYPAVAPPAPAAAPEQGYLQPQPYGYAQGPNPYENRPPQAWAAPVDPRQQAYQASLYAAQKSRVAAGVLALLLGTLGIHNFYLGRTGIAVLQLLLSLLSLGFLAPVVALWALIEGILILVGSPSFAADRRGIPLR